MNRTQRRHPEVQSPQSGEAQPTFSRPAHETQRYGTVVHIPVGLNSRVCAEMAQRLNQILADTMTLRDLYKKCHWQVAGPTFYSLHLLFDKHFQEQVDLVDQIAERIQLLGGVAIAMAPDVAETTKIPRPPRGRETVTAQLSRLADAHETIIKTARQAAREADEAGDDGTNDLLINDVLRRNEMQVWFISEHLVDAPLTTQNGQTPKPTRR